MLGKSIFTKILALLLTTILLISVVACSDTSDSSGKDEVGETTTQSDFIDETSDNRFINVDFKGKEFRINTSINTFDATNANNLIEGTGDINGEFVNDIVYERNKTVEELLNIKFVFTQTDYNYDNVGANIRKIVMAGEDLYDIIINDLYPLAELTYEGMFMNVNNVPNFDYDKPYWYKGYMEDLKLINDRMFIMAGDYFMDVIASAHALFFNKNMINSMYGSPDVIYNHVKDGSWTIDKFISYIENAYLDLDGDGTKNEGDQFGFSAIGMWGSAIPFIIASDINFIDRDNANNIAFSFNNERSVTLLEKLVDVFYNNGTINEIADRTSEGLRVLFAAEKTLFVGYQRLGYLEHMRQIDFEIGIVPYPKLDERQERYVTSSHDTTEVGVIPVTSTEFDFVTTVIEVLNRETASMVIPVYYETALKVKYTRDDISAEMIDIIHDNFGATFPLAYGSSFENFMLNAGFCTPLQNKSTDFASNYAKLETTAQERLVKVVEQLLDNTSN